MRLCRERRSCESGPVMGPVCRLSSVVRGLFHQSVLHIMVHGSCVFACRESIALGSARSSPTGLATSAKARDK